MIFKINYHPVLIVLFELIFSHFLLFVGFLLCSSGYYENVQYFSF